MVGVVEEDGGGSICTWDGGVCFFILFLSSFLHPQLFTFRMGRSWWSDEIGTLGLKQQRTGQDAKRDEIGTLGDGGKEQDGKSDREYGWRWRRMVVASYAHGMGGCAYGAMEVDPIASAWKGEGEGAERGLPKVYA